MNSVNPALALFVAEFPDGLLVAQVKVSRHGAGFELRHVRDTAIPVESLRVVGTGELRGIAMFTADGEFRPLKSVPNLVGGWRAVAPDVAALGSALDQLYPGAVADWHAVRIGRPPVTDYRPFTERQSGMYRVTTKLDDAGVARVIASCCEPGHCLKRRLWTVAGVAPDVADAKSIVPCLEPCAILLDAARLAVRAEQAETV